MKHVVTIDRYYVIAKTEQDGVLSYLALDEANGTGTAYTVEWGRRIPDHSVYNRFAFADIEEAEKALKQMRYNLAENRKWSYEEMGAFVVEVELQKSVKSVC